MIENIIWLALGLLVIASIIPHESRLKLTIAGVGWLFFSVYWALQWQHYYGLADYTNVFLTVLASAFSVIIGVVLIRQDKSLLGNINGISTMESISMASTAAAIGGLSYFVFSEIPSMNELLISAVVNQTIWLASVFGIMVTKLDWNVIAVNGYRVEIILACTAIESIALFIGIIASVRAPFKRLATAFLVSVPVIYGLNLIRNVFVVDAYGMTWFGSPDTSFYVAHTLIAKVGSLIALFVIAYAVLKILPEVLDMIDGILNLVRGIFKHAG